MRPSQLPDATEHKSQARGAGPSPSSPPAASAPASAYAAGSDEAGDSASGAGEDAPGWADYGFASNFVYGRFGDLGPLRRALPSNVLRMSLWNFGREYRALRSTVANGELASLLNSLTGAGALLSLKDMYIYILVEKAAV